ncbi:hypothetical protein [Candidatus Amarobacter glycogenicus]|uniref:hypothetical protein n=1 Tax=Candidatus Amarobacter glycogenicus TaxID=3140699 RepID=UPI002A10CEA9|nr:hypothetical protein [Dehalococcoidia bacterium]
MKYRALWGAAVGGLAIHFLGLGWDVYRHSSDSTLAQREDVLSLGNPSHLMIVVGMAIVAASLLGMAAAWMAERRLGGDGLPGAMVRGVSLPFISIVAGGSIWLASTAEDGSHDHGTTDHVHAPGTPEDHPHDSEGGPGTQDSAAFLVARQGSAAGVATHGHTNGAAAEEDSMGEGSAHTHGIEVAVSGEQLLAAGKFAAAVKEKTAKYIDVREALTAGYVQITPDLPGIAAHFIRSDYQRTGTRWTRNVLKCCFTASGSTGTGGYLGRCSWRNRRVRRRHPTSARWTSGTGTRTSASLPGRRCARPRAPLNAEGACS